MDDPRLDLIIGAVVVKVVGELKAEFRPPHEQTRCELAELRATVAKLSGMVAKLSGTVADLVGTVAEMSGRLAEIEEPAGYAYQVGKAMGAATGATLPPPFIPVPGTRRPAAVDRACAVAGTPDARPAIIPEYGNLVIHPKRGYSPSQVYDDVVESIQDARSSNGERSASETTGLRRSRRTKKH